MKDITKKNGRVTQNKMKNANENRLKEKHALSILYSNSTFGHIERAKDQIENIGRSDVSKQTAKQLDRIKSLLEQVLIISYKIDEKY